MAGREGRELAFLLSASAQKGKELGRMGVQGGIRGGREERGY